MKTKLDEIINNIFEKVFHDFMEYLESNIKLIVSDEDITSFIREQLNGITNDESISSYLCGESSWFLYYFFERNKNLIREEFNSKILELLKMIYNIENKP